MPTVYTLLATQVPAITQPSALLVPSVLTPTVSKALITGDTTAVKTKLNENAVRLDAIGRAGSGAYCVDWDSGPNSSTPGLNITSPSVLTVTVGTGQAIIDSVVVLNVAANVTGIVDNAENYIWLSQAGALSRTGTTTAPGANFVYLGRVTTSGGAVTAIDGSGVLYMRGSTLFRRTADTGVPGDTPPTGIWFTNYSSASGTFLWTGEGYVGIGLGSASLGTQAMADANQTPTAAVYQNRYIRLTGALTQQRNLTLPALAGSEWVIINECTPAAVAPLTDPSVCSVLVKTASGSGFVVDAGTSAMIRGDGTNIVGVLGEFWIDVRSKGARGDGSTDDYAVIQSAYDQVQAGGTVFFPAGKYKVSTGLVNNAKRVDTVGVGKASILKPGANGMTVLTYMNPAATDFDRGCSRCKIDNIAVFNTDNRTTCKGIVLDRAHRISLHHVWIGNSTESARFDAGLQPISSYILDIDNCFFHHNVRGIDCETFYFPVVNTSDGPTHGMHVRGGEIQDNQTGVYLKDSTSVAFVGTVIEGNTVVDVTAVGVFKLTFDGVYWEPLAGIYNVDLSGVWRDVRIDGATRIKARNGYDLLISNFRDKSTSLLDLDQAAAVPTVFNVTMTNTWWDDVATANTTTRAAIWQAVEKGILRIVGSGTPFANIIPADDVGVNLLRNAGFSNSADGWALGGMTANTSVVPFGSHTSLAATVAGTASKAIDPAFVNELRDRYCVMSCMVNIPNTSWLGGLECLDGDAVNGNRVIPIDNTLKDGTWRRISAMFRVSGAATGLSFALQWTSAGAGTAYFAMPTLTLGSIARRPEIAPHLLPPLYSELPVMPARTAQSLTNTSQIDPTKSAFIWVTGSAGPVTMLTSQTLFSNPSQWKRGMRVTLMGESDTDTVTLQTGGSTKIVLQNPTRVLGANEAIQFFYDFTNDLWLEIDHSPTARNGVNNDITSLIGLAGIITGIAHPIQFARGTQNMANADQTAASGVYSKLMIEVSSSPGLSANRTLTLPAHDASVWFIINLCTGFNLILKTAAGTGVTLLPGENALIYGDGTNIKRMMLDPWAERGVNSSITSLTGLTGAILGNAQPIQFGRATQSMADGDKTAASGVYSRLQIELTDAITLNRNLILPTVDASMWVIKNNTTGGFSVVCKTAAGAGVTIAPGETAWVRGNGVDIIRVSLDPWAERGANTNITSLVGLTGPITGNAQPLQWSLGTQAMLDADQTAAAAVYQHRYVRLTDAITANRVLTLPTVTNAEWVIINDCTGAFAVQAKTVAGTGPLITNGTTATIRCDGTNMKLVTAGVVH